jgi:dihydroorotate dehydrogenase electron transfer subunit
VTAARTGRWLGRAPILEHREVKPRHYMVCIGAPEVAAVAQPGQFLHIVCGDSTDPLLRRPFSVSRVGRECVWVEFIYRVVGEGTELLSRRTVGDRLDVMGPLGTPFRPESGARHILVGGGVGIPPMLFLAETLRESLPGDEVAVLLGGRTADLVLCEDDFAGIGLPPRIITDDGSMGRQGLVTELLAEALGGGGPAVVYACGPVPMLRAVARVAADADAPCQVAFEARMACGVGACLSCVIPTTAGFQRVCTEGPAFDASVVVWDADLDLH